MSINFNNIDEIGVFHNDDGSYLVELYMSTTTGERVTMTMPQASLDLSLSTGYGEGMSIELKLEGMVSLL